MKNWKEYRFSDFVDINPKITLKSNQEYSFVEMKDLNESSKHCEPSQKRILKGGARFEEGDTLFARITPCLENGKICQVRNLENGVGYGSTEFLVFRGKKDISDTDFVFYLSRYDDVRNFAESNFDGTSGRQRVPKSAFDNLYLVLPPPPIQKAIASTLNCLDAKIDLLHRQNEILEEMAETLFRKWFVEDAKENWKTGTVSDVATHLKKSVNPQKHPDIEFQHYSIPSFDNAKQPLSELGSTIQSSKYILEENAILFSKLNPQKDKRVWLLQDEVLNNSICSTEFQIIKPIDEGYLYFLYGWLTLRENYNKIASGSGGTSGSHQRIDPSTIFSFHCPKIPPNYIEEFNKKSKLLFQKQINNSHQIKNLNQLRDSLLPQLISGAIKLKA
ncbi:restriction endonuclease subunit S [Niabella pedocola]|uniref:Restriction endonuclease subunit S n=1 Tax=Niabella pedocola TaxID=1752077 RepID=A0ABS8PV43_9BACT|nr:restriction endonuclease subunit S [Niabella pedocola]MCD2424938.1 restriction endonuclease subunit S [Niabella pedocola]